MAPNTFQIDYRILRLIVGLIALSIAIVATVLFWQYSGSSDVPTSISVTYHLGARDFFVGSLFAVGAFLFAYNGFDGKEKVAAKVAGLCAILIAVCPTTVSLDWIDTANIPFAESDCVIVTTTEDTEYRSCHTVASTSVASIHMLAAVLLIGVLIYYCIGFYKRAGDKLKAHPSMTRLIRRRIIYLACAAAMLLSVVIGGAYKLLNNTPENPAVFWIEFVCLSAFGISWLVASKRIPLLSHTAKEEDSADEEL